MNYIQYETCRVPFDIHFKAKNILFGTGLNLVTILRRESFYFVDEICSRHHFSVRNALFWRRAPFSSPFLSEKRLFLATSLVFVTIFE
ncbi:hypothetical protein [Caldibacillus thermoamylovorans]|uniref:hypothetical protein n=1 Tax=Caldibacillus thermoamylovorans TaxID=35841 RepID=UPI000B28F856|nr:hypothetical protein [Caldibacillus thermoamylovorans]